ncbi:hypothetical protein M4D79_11945 [Mycolicibacterium novocastrense]|nr:hypothetical protein M4D79_11945 [Mycolicibacterium novocastrense]
MAELTDFRDALSGDTGASAGLAFALAIHSFVNWPPDAFSTEVKNQYVQTLYWVQGDAVGYRSPRATKKIPYCGGELRSVADIENVTLGAKIVDNRGFGPGEVRRVVEVKFKSGEEIKIDVAACTNQHQRNLANAFINTILGAVAGEDVEAVTK